MVRYCENTDIYEDKIRKNNSYKLVYPSLISFVKLIIVLMPIVNIWKI